MIDNHITPATSHLYQVLPFDKKKKNNMEHLCHISLATTIRLFKMKPINSVLIEIWIN